MGNYFKKYSSLRGINLIYNSESKLYDKMLNLFSELNNNTIKSELLKNQSIIELMKLLNDNGDKLSVKNALLIIMALFDDCLVDTFYFNSKNIRNATDRNKNILISILKDEFLS